MYMSYINKITDYTNMLKCNKYVYMAAVGCAMASFAFYKTRSQQIDKYIGNNDDDIKPGDLFNYVKIASRPDTGIENELVYPIVYNSNYDIKFYRFEKLHNFDTQKWGHIYQILNQHFTSQGAQFTTISPVHEVTRAELQLAHTEQFISDIHYKSSMIAQAAEMYMLRFVPSSFLQSALVTPFKWHTSGTVLAAHMALKYGWAINLGGGFHHASSARAQGFCFFADITMAIQYLWKYVDEDLNFMIIDLDAHQGNGYELDKFIMSLRQKKKVYVLDAYNKDIYPMDEMAQNFINTKVELLPNTSDDEYLKQINESIGKALKEFSPSLIIYNAGSDILNGDPLGGLNITEQGLFERDRVVFNFAKNYGIPIVMLTSGGYQRSNAQVIANSIINLLNGNLIEPVNENNIKSTGSHQANNKNSKL